MSTPIERVRALLPLPECESLLECPKCGALAGPALKHIYDRVVRVPDLALLVKLADAVKARRDAEATLYQGPLCREFIEACREASANVDAILAELEAQ